MFARSALFALVGVGALCCACSSSAPPDNRDYATRITEARTVKDADFLRASNPIPESKKAEFLPLAYFPVDPAYNVPAVLKPTDDTSIFTMSTSTGQPRQERRAGTLEFTLQNQPMTLMAFVEAEAPNMNRLFVPFADLTTGIETYSGGRFLDLDRTGTGVYELDFNKAYTPYCYYNPSFECPYPPAENRLKVAIKAGERMRPASQAAAKN